MEHKPHTNRQLYPILEFDNTQKAILEPSAITSRHEDMPERVVLCFFQDVLKTVCEDLPVVYHLGSEIGKNPVYRLNCDGVHVAVVHAGVGAALSATFMEELIALGGRTFVVCGGAGALKPELSLGHIIVPEFAVRDEGTSYHYLPPSRNVRASQPVVTAIQTVLNQHQVPYFVGGTWTTDAPYRETPGKVAQRREEGCLTVEMEAAALFAVAQFRNVQCGQILYCGDDVSGLEWDHRNWHRQTSIRENLFWLAMEAVVLV